MDTSGQGETFRLALSYLERAQAELRQWERLRADGKLDRTNYDLVHATYTAHERDAQRLCDALRHAAERELGPAKETLRLRQRAQRKLIEAVSAGGVDPRQANDQNRRLTAEIAADTTHVDVLEAIVSSETTAGLGGAIVLPLEEYPKRLDLGDAGPAAPRRKLGPQEKNLIAGAVMLVLVLGSVFGLALYRSNVRAKFSVTTNDVPAGFVRVQCTNQGNRTIRFYAPWPNGKAMAPAKAPGAKQSFGVVLFVREAAGGPYRELEGVGGIWKFRGVYLDEGTPFEVAPGTTEPVFLDVKRLREQGVNVDALALEFSRNGGAERQREEVHIDAPPDAPKRGDTSKKVQPAPRDPHAHR